jgi:RHS repeat-associated protein
VSTLLFALSAHQLQAQVGNNNPGGVAGIFNGNVTTGCSYDPYTGNAHRTITDIIVAGAVGEYPLALTRTSNSRNAWGNAFGLPGAWRHNYQWSIQVSARGTAQQDIHYTVDFPDGRTETFNYSASDVNYRAVPGVRERLKPWTATNGTYGVCYLVLPDGGKVEFSGTRTFMYDPELIPPNWYEFDLVATAIIDPYGLRMTFTYDAYRRLYRVTEPAGRYLQFYYRTTSGPTIDHVTGSDGRSVQYIYGYSAFSPGTTNYLWLGHVAYYGNSTWTAHYKYRAPNVGNVNGLPLLWTCDDPMYPGPMRMIAYAYKTGTNPDGTAAVYGQILSENWYNGTNSAPVSTLTVNTPTTRTETRGDGQTRTFTYSATGYLTSLTDFKGVSASQTYDANKYVNSVTDRNGHTTNFSSNALNGNMTLTTFPFTLGDTPGQTQRPTIQYTYGWASCADPNNRDANNPYYVCTARDEGGHVTQFLRDTNKRITRINYPDGGYETFSYNSFGQVLTHRMTTGGTESFTYDTRGLKQTYRNPSNATGNPTARYTYNAFDWVHDLTDVLGASFGDPYHSTSFIYNLRGQVTTTALATDPVDNARDTVVNTYNPDGTLQRRVNELNQTTSYTYDDYRRLKSVTPPVRGAGDNSPHTTDFHYDINGTGDYNYTDSNMTYVALPSGKIIKNRYDDNRRKISVTAAFGTADAAITSYEYDNVGNVTKVANPRNYATRTTYDERNRPWKITDASNQITEFKYDLYGRKKSITRPNNQVITYESYDQMNRLLQQSATQTPTGLARTKYTYYPSGLLKTMQDPRLVGTVSPEKYEYIYDTMGRKTRLNYPYGYRELFSYDTAGRLQTFNNRMGKIQTFTYDALHRMTGFNWNDGLTPSVTFGYDAHSRLTAINNANATISRLYFNDDLLRAETETITGGVARQVIYAYDADGNRASIQYPGSYLLNYTYTGRNQVKTFGNPHATYTYDLNGNLTSRTLINGTASTWSYDALDRAFHIAHGLHPTRRLDYGFDSVGNRKWTKRDQANGDVFRYDQNDQVIGVQLNIPNPDSAPTPAQTIIYDANGNRTTFRPYGPTETYMINDLNQYTVRNGNPATYTGAGNLGIDFDGSPYAYDAQNRLLNATRNGVRMDFKYDGLNRQVSRTVGGVTTYNVYDGWDLIEEYQGNGTIVGHYTYGPEGLVFSGSTQRSPYWVYHYQDGAGSTSHIADTSGNLLEWYRYDLQGTPIFYDANNNQRSTSNYAVRHLFTGQQWYSELGLYDLRNRFYSPDLGRFLQPDPIGFNGDPTNLYRYCRNNPVKWSDPSGLLDDGMGGPTLQSLNGSLWRVIVEGTEISPSGLDPFRDFPGGATDWGTVGSVLDYLGGMDHGTPGHFRGLGDGSGGFSIGTGVTSPLPTLPRVTLPSYPLTIPGGRKLGSGINS